MWSPTSWLQISEGVVNISNYYSEDDGSHDELDLPIQYDILAAQYFNLARELEDTAAGSYPEPLDPEGGEEDDLFERFVDHDSGCKNISVSAVVRRIERATSDGAKESIAMGVLNKNYSTDWASSKLGFDRLPPGDPDADPEAYQSVVKCYHYFDFI